MHDGRRSRFRSTRVLVIRGRDSLAGATETWYCLSNDGATDRLRTLDALPSGTSFGG